ncbi:transposase [Vibrio splendidus]
MLDFPLTCPSYSQLSRRLQGLNIKTPLYQKQHNTQIENNDVVALTIDSTGLKRFGRDE